MPNLPEHVETLRANAYEVHRLLEIHTELTGTGAGRRHNVQVLNKSAILMIVATWESVVEALAICGTEFLCDELEDPYDLPAGMLTTTSKRLERHKHDNEVWRLAGEGWRSAVLETTKLKVDKLNTPNARNVDEIFEAILGYPKLSKQWCWKGCSQKSVEDRLKSLIDLRHEIAHQVEASRSVTKDYAKRSLNFVVRISAISSNRIRTHIQKVSGVSPWTTFYLGASI